MILISNILWENFEAYVDKVNVFFVVEVNYISYILFNLIGNSYIFTYLYYTYITIIIYTITIKRR